MYAPSVAMAPDLSRCRRPDLPRPAIEQQVRQAVRDDLANAASKPPYEAPLNVLAVARRTGFDRKTLKKYGLDAEIVAAARQQSRGSKLSPKQEQRRSDTDALHVRDQEIALLRQRCEGLVGQICLAEGNAQRLGIDPTELWKPLPMPDRSVSRAGGLKPRRA